MPQDYTVDTKWNQRSCGHVQAHGCSGISISSPAHLLPSITSKPLRTAGKISFQALILTDCKSLSVLSDDEKESGVCLVDIGGGTTDIAISMKISFGIPLWSSWRQTSLPKDIKGRMHWWCRIMQNYFKDSLAKAIAEEATQMKSIYSGLEKIDLQGGFPSRNLASNYPWREWKEIIEIVYRMKIMQSGHYRIGWRIVLTAWFTAAVYLSAIWNTGDWFGTRDWRTHTSISWQVSDRESKVNVRDFGGLVACGFKGLRWSGLKSTKSALRMVNLHQEKEPRELCSKDFSQIKEKF